MKSPAANAMKKLKAVDNMLVHFEKYHFLNLDGVFGFNGNLVKSYIYQEWLLSNVHHCDEPTFVVSSNVDYEMKNILPVTEKLPFSLVHIAENSKHFFKKPEENNENCQIRRLFDMVPYTSISKHVYCSPTESTALFHKLQRDRKIWWRKLSAVPGRFALTEITQHESNQSQSVNIQAEFPWGTECIEKVECLTSDRSLHKVKDGRKLVLPHKVVIEFSLQTSTLIYLCDAYDPINEDTGREIMRFHRKMAPYKISFAAAATSAPISKDLSDLALLLARKIRKAGVPCLLLPDFTKKSLDSQYFRADAMGIPYTIVLGDKTLIDGMLSLRSRDTTLKVVYGWSQILRS